MKVEQHILHQQRTLQSNFIILPTEVANLLTVVANLLTETGLGGVAPPTPTSAP